MLSEQRVFTEILPAFLKRIDYSRVTKLATKWSIADGIVIDPALCLVKPVVEDVCIRTSTLASAYEANGQDSEHVADWYGVLPIHVMAASILRDSSLHGVLL